MNTYDTYGVTMINVSTGEEFVRYIFAENEEAAQQVAQMEASWYENFLFNEKETAEIYTYHLYQCATYRINGGATPQPN